MPLRPQSHVAPSATAGPAVEHVLERPRVLRVVENGWAMRSRPSPVRRMDFGCRNAAADPIDHRPVHHTVMRRRCGRQSSMSCSTSRIAARPSSRKQCQCVPLGDPHSRERLVEEQHLRLRGKAHGDLELALLAMREKPRLAIERALESGPCRGTVRGGRTDFAARGRGPPLPRPLVACLRGEAAALEPRMRKDRAAWLRPSPARARSGCVQRVTSAPSSSRGREDALAKAR